MQLERCQHGSAPISFYPLLHLAPSHAGGNVPALIRRCYEGRDFFKSLFWQEETAEAYSLTSRRHVRTTAVTAKMMAYPRVTSKVCVPSTGTRGGMPMELALN